MLSADSKNITFRFRLAAIIGNILEHYDGALFALLAPFIAPLFFGESDPVQALILTYGILPLGLFTRPLGSLFFGWIGDKWGRREALFIALLGMAIATCFIGCLPTYTSIGIYAPVLLALGRMVQNFFAAGEASGGAIFVLENTEDEDRDFLSSIYSASTIGGILIASFFVTLFSHFGYVEEGWRLLFWGGGITAVIGLFLRLKGEEGKEFAVVSEEKTPFFLMLKEQKGPLFTILLTAGFSYTTYSFVFTFMNGYIPLVTTLTKADVMKINTLLLVIDMALLPLFGYLSKKIGKHVLMTTASFASALLALPLFFFLDHSSFAVVTLVRLVILILGVAFAAPYHAWAIEQVPTKCRYTIVSLGNALGTQLIGTPSSAVCLWLYQAMEWGSAPGLYLLVVGLGASLAVARSKTVVPTRQIETA